MLDISIYHSTNSLVTQGVEEDEEAQAGIAEFEPGSRDRAGNVKVALQRYINNECRIINLYNRYWAGPGNPASTAPTPALVSAATARWKRASSAMTATSPTPTPARPSVRTTSAVTARSAAARLATTATGSTPTPANTCTVARCGVASCARAAKSATTATRSTTTTAQRVPLGAAVTASAKALSSAMTVTTTTTTPARTPAVLQRRSHR